MEHGRFPNISLKLLKTFFFQKYIKASKYISNFKKKQVWENKFHETPEGFKRNFIDFGNLVNIRPKNIFEKNRECF